MTTRNSRALLLVAVGLVAACDRGFLHNLPPAEAPLCGPAPNELVATFETDQVVLRWTTTLTTADGYLVERSAADEPWTSLVQLDANARSYTDTAIEPIGAYDYRIRGVRGACTTDPSISARIYTLPRTPAAAHAEPQDAHAILLSWRDTNDYEDGYTVERRASGETSYTRAVTSTGADVESYTVTGLAADTIYELRVAALRQGGGNSDWATASSWTGPGTPGNLVVSAPSGSMLHLAWTAVDNPHLTGFRIERRRPGYGQFQVVTTTTRVARVYDDSGLQPAAEYDYRVYAEPGAPDATPAAASGTTGTQPLLAWAGAPTIDSVCTLHVAGTVVLDTLHGATLDHAAASVSHAHGAISADANGFSAALIDPTPVAIATSWTVVDNRQTEATLSRDLVLAAVTPGLVHTVRAAPAATQGDAASEGRQPWLSAFEAPAAGRCGNCLGRIGSLALNDHTCALVADGRVRCWGRNANGQVGDGSQVEQRFPSLVCASGSYLTSNCVPLTGIAALAAGETSSCALRDDGQVMCWGGNGSGRLGDGTYNIQLNPVTVCASGDAAHGNCDPLRDVAALAVGAWHACALQTDTSVVCWGDALGGQTGNGASGLLVNFPHPVAVCSTGTTTNNSCTPLTGASALTAGGWHSCAIVGDGVQCWGSDAQGQLGDGVSSSVQHNPVRVCATGSGVGCPPLTSAIALAAGLQHTCALLQNGRVRCWGTHDQVGDGDATVRPYDANPVAVCASGSVASANCIELEDAIALAAGYRHTCALRGNGQVMCWGANQTGALGNGQQNEVRRNPVAVCTSGTTNGGDCAPLSGVAAIAAGEQYGCALLDDDTMKCWGNGCRQRPKCDPFSAGQRRSEIQSFSKLSVELACIAHGVADPSLSCETQ